jgi:hypothetical protein
MLEEERMKRILTRTLLMTVCVAGLLQGSAMADSISPASFSAMLAEGESVTVHKIVTVSAGTPTSSKVDVFFLADETGSMGGIIDAVKTSASTILSSTAGLGDVAFGVGGYRDVGDAFVYRELTDLTTDQPTAQAAINTWSASGGGDAPEAQLYALEQLATGTSWRAGSERIAVWFGDYPGHDPSVGGITEAAATAALQAQSIAVQAISVGANQLDSTGQATRITAATGGTFYSGISTDDIVDTIQAAITTAVETYTTVGLDLLEVPVGVTAVAVPASYVGSYDRSIERVFNFDLTFTMDTAGTYGFNIYGTVDGGRVATEADSLSVVPVPGALLLGMLGLSVAGVRLRKRA